MAELDITRVIVTPMQRVVVEWEPAAVLPLGYTISAVHGLSRTGMVAMPGEHLARFCQLGQGFEYDLQVAAHYADEDDTVTGAVTKVTIDPQASFAAVLRQAVWDIIYGSTVPVHMLHDGVFRPDVYRRAEVLGIAPPLCEVGMPTLRSSAWASGIREEEQWQIPIRILCDGQSNNADALDTPWILWQQIKRAINATECLNISVFGVLDKAWSWSVQADAVRGRNRLTGLLAELTVSVQTL